MSIDKYKLENAIQNVKEESIVDTNLSEIKTIKNNVLQQLQLSKEKLLDFHKRLEKYKFIDEITELNCGDYVRWIDLNNPSNIKIANGAFICDIEINKDGIHLKLKTISNRHIQLRMDEIFLFRKLTDDELVILSALKYINK